MSARAASTTPRRTWWPTALELLAVAGITAAWIALGRLFNQAEPDFAVYYGAARLHDNLYGANVVDPSMPQGGLPFTYPPVAALLFQPLSLLPMGSARLLFECLEGAAAYGAVRLVFRRAAGRRPGLLALFLSTIYASNVAMGQVNLLLLLFVLSDFVPSRVRPRWLPAGIGVGIATAVKITPAVFVVYLLVTGWRRAALVATSTTVVMTAVGWLFLPESTAAFTRLLPDLWQRVDVLHYFGTVNNTGLTGLLAQAGLLEVPSSAVTVCTVLIGLIVAVLVRGNGRFTGPLMLSCAIAMGAPVTWLHHWVALPLLLAVLLERTRSRASRIVLAVALMMQILGSAYASFLLPAGPEAISLLLAASPCVATVIAAAVALRSARSKDSAYPAAPRETGISGAGLLSTPARRDTLHENPAGAK